MISSRLDLYNSYPLGLNKDRIIGIDFGLRNIVAIANNVGLEPIVIKGGVWNSINQYYNKVKGKIQSIYDRQKLFKYQEIKIDEKNKKIVPGKIKYRIGYTMQILTVNRNNKIKDLMHKYSRSIIDYCILHNIGTIVIGYDPEWKQNITVGMKANEITKTL